MKEKSVQVSNQRGRVGEESQLAVGRHRTGRRAVKGVKGNVRPHTSQQDKSPAVVYMPMYTGLAWPMQQVSSD